MTVRILVGDVRARLKELPDQSIHCCITSPPYFGLRDYGMDGQIGLERTPVDYIAELGDVFAEVRRVLRDDGTLWLNLGDSYSTGTGGDRNEGASGRQMKGRARECTGKPKDLLMIPARVALALQAPYEVVAIKDRADRAWMAALVDGEGCITTTVARGSVDSGRAQNESYAIIIAIRMADRQCLDRVVEITGMSNVQAESHPPSHVANGQRPTFNWKIAGENAAAVLAEIYPYLRIKRGQAVAAWNLQRLKDGIVHKRGTCIPHENMEKRRELHRIIRALNQRETVDIPGWCGEPAFTIKPGWYLRSSIIWHKPNPMPESVTDRPTSAHEHIFLLAKSERYYFDADAVKEIAAYPIADDRKPSGDYSSGSGRNDGGQHRSGGFVTAETRNIRNVWTIATQPFSEAHFATFPPALIEPCIKAGCPEGGTVLDPFGGAGTTGLVADRLKRNAILFELNPEYAEIARKRIQSDAGMFSTVEVAA